MKAVVGGTTMGTVIGSASYVAMTGDLPSLQRTAIFFTIAFVVSLITLLILERRNAHNQ